MDHPHATRVEAFFAALGSRIVRFRWLVIAFWILLTVVSVKALPSLGSEINNNNSQFLPASAPSNRASILANPLFGNANTISQIIVVASSDHGPLSDAAAITVRNEAALLKQVPRVDSVRLIGVSRDQVAAQLLINARVSPSDVTAQKTLVDNIEGTFRAVDPAPGVALHVAGEVAINVANQSGSARTGSKVQSLSILLIVFLLFLIFRSLLAPVVTLFPPVLALVISERFIGGLGAHGLQISEITELLLIVLLLGAGTDYGLFLVFRVREEIRAGRNHHEAVAYSLGRVGESISASGATVIFALLTLLFASFGIYRDLGIPLAVGIAVMLVAGLTLLPALLAVLGNAVFWPTRVIHGDAQRGWWGGTTTRLLQHPLRTLALGIVVLGALASAALGFKSGGFGGAVNAPAGTNAAIGSNIIAAHFPSVSNDPTNLIFRFATPVWDDPDELEVMGQQLRKSGAFTSISGPLDVTGTPLSPGEFAALHRALGPPEDLPAVEPASAGIPADLYNAYRASTIFVSADGRTMQFEVNLRAGNAQSNGGIDAVPHVRSITTSIAHAVGATDSGVAGTAPALYDVSHTSDADLLHIIPIAIVAIGLLLAIVLRSLVAPLYLIVSVGISYFAALGVAVIVFMDVGGQSGLTFILPFLMFIFLLALGEDYNILVMTRIREEARRFSLHDAVIHAVERTGTTITSAGVVLAGTFAVFAVAGSNGPGGSQIRAIGIGLSIGVLMDTFVVRTILVPATVSVLGRWNWWPSRLFHLDPSAAQADKPVELDAG